MTKRDKKQIGLVYSREEYEILEGIAEAFFKAGAIPRKSVTQLIMWNTRKLVADIMTKRKEQLREEFEKQEAERRKIELQKQYPHLYGEQGVGINR